MIKQGIEVFQHATVTTILITFVFLQILTNVLVEVIHAITMPRVMIWMVASHAAATSVTLETGANVQVCCSTTIGVGFHVDL